MKITKAHITRFRGFKDVEFHLGSHLTAVAGQNGTQKTTLLGILSQTFSLTGKDNPIVKNKEKPLSGGSYRSKFSEKFKLSPSFDTPKSHEWTLFFKDDEEGLTIESMPRSKETDEIRFWRKGDRSKGSGYVQAPVIYLSLLRLIPIGEDSELNESNQIKLTDEELEFYKRWHNKILKITRDELTTPNYLASKVKNTLGANTSYYDWKMNSAGQDNIGKIILSVLSFRRLQKKYPKAYNGGLLVIDEIETTLYPASQLALIDFLNKFASKNNFQVLFTTHSLIVLERLCEIQEDKRREDQVKVVFLEKVDNSVKVLDSVGYSAIRHKLNVSLDLVKPKFKINTFTEDEEAKIFAKAILKIKRTKSLKFLNVKMGCANYIELARTKVTGFNFPESLIILDGDVNRDKKALRKTKSFKNCIVLPKDESPEVELAKFLYNLKDESEHWNKISHGYNHQICFTNYTYMEICSDRKKSKAWFNEQKKYWGRGCSRLINLWIKENQKEVDEFLSDFDSAVNNFQKTLGF